jgi:hypothetical protein
MLRSPPRLFTHRGWRHLDPAADGPVWRGGKDVRRIVEDDAIAAVQVGDDMICIHTSHAVELWDVPRDRLIVRRPMEGVVQLVALADGCAARDAEEIRLLGAQGERGRVPLEVPPGAMAYSGGRLLVATFSDVVIFDGKGNEVGRRDVDAGLTALAWLDEPTRLVLGYRDGSVEVVPAGDRLATAAPGPSDDGEEPRSPAALALLQTPASAPQRIVAGPLGTLIVGFGNGELGIWSGEDGSRLARGRLHGSVIHLAVEDKRLIAATDLGQHLVWSLDPFYRGYCQLLEDLWERLPVVWRHGVPVAEPPPTDHRCRR